MSGDLPELLCRVNFPLYQAMMISPRHLLVGGGGGAAKTGVFNGVVRIFIDFLIFLITITLLLVYMYRQVLHLRKSLK